MEYQDYVERLRADEPELAGELAPFHTLESVLPWMDSRGLPLASVDVVFQDEYSHDFLIPLEAGGKYLVFGIT
jgi:hypothetical protein